MAALKVELMDALKVAWMAVNLVEKLAGSKAELTAVEKAVK